MPETQKWDWLKEKTAEAVVNAVVLGLVMLVGYGILQAFIGDSKLDKATEQLRQEMIDKHNASIVREGELLGQIVELKTMLKDKIGPPEELPTPPVLYAPSYETPPNPAQQRLDFEQKHRMPYKK